MVSSSTSKYRVSWSSSSLKFAKAKFTNNVLGELNAKGSKLIYKNPDTGTSIVHDVERDYFRIQNKDGHYLNLEGKTVNAPKNLEGKEASDYI